MIKVNTCSFRCHFVKIFWSIFMKFCVKELNANDTWNFVWRSWTLTTLAVELPFSCLSVFITISSCFNTDCQIYVQNFQPPLTKMPTDSEGLLTTTVISVSQVSVYSGPLHNDRMTSAEDQSTVSLADRLANARMMQKSGYTWDPAGSCAKIRWHGEMPKNGIRGPSGFCIVMSCRELSFFYSCGLQ